MSLCVHCQEVEATTEYSTHISDHPMTFQVCEDCKVKMLWTDLLNKYRPFIKAFSQQVNSCSPSRDDAKVVAELFLNEHRQLQNYMIAFIHQVLQEIGKKSGDVVFEDVRNEWALSWAKTVGNIYTDHDK